MQVHSKANENFVIAKHFQENLLERYKLVFTIGQILALKHLIQDKKIEQVTRTTAIDTAIFKYVYRRGAKQTRIYVVAEVSTGHLISVMKPAWMKKLNKPAAKKDRDPRQRRSNRSRRPL